MPDESNNEDDRERRERTYKEREQARRSRMEDADYDEWARPQRPTVITVFNELGIDVRNDRRLREFRELLEYLAEQKRREEWWRSRRMGWMVLFITTVAGSVFGTIANWVLSRKGG